MPSCLQCTKKNYLFLFYEWFKKKDKQNYDKCVFIMESEIEIDFRLKLNTFTIFIYKFSPMACRESNALCAWNDYTKFRCQAKIKIKNTGKKQNRLFLVCHTTILQFHIKKCLNTFTHLVHVDEG